MFALIFILIMCSPFILGILIGRETKEYLDTNPPATHEGMRESIHNFGRKLVDFAIRIGSIPLRLLQRIIP